MKPEAYRAHGVHQVRGRRRYSRPSPRTPCPRCPRRCRCSSITPSRSARPAPSQAVHDQPHAPRPDRSARRSCSARAMRARPDRRCRRPWNRRSRTPPAWARRPGRRLQQALPGDPGRCGGTRGARTPPLPDARDHGGVVQRVGEHDQAGQDLVEARQRPLVGDVARGEQQRTRLCRAGPPTPVLQLHVHNGWCRRCCGCRPSRNRTVVDRARAWPASTTGFWPWPR